MESEDRKREPSGEPVDPRRHVRAGVVFKIAAVATATAVLVLCVAYALYVVRQILVLVLVGLFVAVSLEPVVRWLTRKGLRRPLAVAVIVLGVLVLVGFFIGSVVPPIIDQGGRLFSDLPGLLQSFSDQWKPIREFTDRYHLTDRLASLVASIPSTLAGGAVGFLKRTLGGLASTGTVLILAIYFMADMPRLTRNVVRLYPPRRRARIEEIWETVVRKVGGYLIGNLIISLFAGVSAYICLRLVGVPFALPLAVTVAVADLIPMIGATLGAVICVVITVFTKDIWPHAVIVLLFFIAYQQLENYLIAPRVMRDTVKMPAIAVLLVALIGGAALGLVGAIMAIPLAAAVKVIVSPSIETMYEPADAQPPRTT